MFFVVLFIIICISLMKYYVMSCHVLSTLYKVYNLPLPAAGVFAGAFDRPGFDFWTCHIIVLFLYVLYTQLLAISLSKVVPVDGIRC